MEDRVKDHYSLLNISLDASASAIKKAYRLLALKYHPDKNAEDANAQENFQILQDAYDILIDDGARELYDYKRYAYGVAPSVFLPPAPRPKPTADLKPASKNEATKEAFRKARLAEKLEAARLAAEQEKQEQQEAARLAEQERLHSIAAERIRAAREAQKEAQRAEEVRWEEVRGQERYQRYAADRIREERERVERERRREERRREAEMRREEEELAEMLRQWKFGKKTAKGVPANNWWEEEVEMLVELKRWGMSYAEIAGKLNEKFGNGRGKESCRRKYVKLGRMGIV